jgi:hypothetical protein
MTISRLTQQFLCTTSLRAFQLNQAPDVGRSAQSPKRKKNNKYLTLEPRMMFDGAMAATDAEFAHEVVDYSRDASHDTVAESQNLFEALSVPPPDMQPMVYRAVAPLTLAFIDGSLEDIDVLIADLGPNVEVHILETQSDGVDQIAAILDGRQDVSALHIISHGVAGGLNLGSGQLTAGSISGSYAEELAVIKSALSENADILIYGCDFAAGEVGRNAVNLLAEVTGADVAASEDMTGAAQLGGNWVLEDRVGVIDSRVLDARDWQHILAPLNIAITASPAVIGASGTNAITGLVEGGVNFTALWTDAGTIGTAHIDLRATVVSVTGGPVSFITQGDDASAILNSPGTMVIKWEIFATGTNIPAFGSPNFNVADIDGSGGLPNSREIVVPSLNGLTAYTINATTDLVASVSPAGVSVSGTQNEIANPPVAISLAQFSWKNVSTWNVSYTLQPGFTNAVFRHDGNGSFTFTSPNTVALLSLDLDGNDTTATGSAYQANYVENAAGISISDADTVINQNAALGTTLGGATIVLTNAQANDVLAAATLPPGISAVIDTSVAGHITVTLSGSDTVANYQAAINAIKFSNTGDTPNTTDRKIEVSVTNTLFGTTSDVAISTIRIVIDTDGDGILDVDDIDDDNDGILDIVELRPGKLDLADFSGWVAGSRTGTVSMPTGGTVAINTVSSYSPGSYVAQAGFPKGTTAPELATFVGQSEFNAAFPDGLLGPTSGLTIWRRRGGNPL